MELSLVRSEAEDEVLDPAPVVRRGAGSGAHEGERGAGREGEGYAALAAGVARGDEQALAALYEAWFQRALALAKRATRGTPLRDEAACLDIVQDAFIRVVRSIRPMASDEEVQRWMARVVKTTALDHLRREARRAERERRAVADRGESPEMCIGAAVELAERIEVLQREMDGLTEDERALLGLRFGRGRTLEEAGAAAGMTGGAAHGRLRRVMDRLRRAIGSVLDER